MGAKLWPRFVGLLTLVLIMNIASIQGVPLTQGEKSALETSWNSIENTRKKSITIVLKDDNNQTMKDVKVEVVQRRLAFSFIVANGVLDQPDEPLLCPSGGSYLYVPWKSCEPVKRVYQFDRLVGQLEAVKNTWGIADSHIYIGPSIEGGTANTEIPSWIDSTNIALLKDELRAYLEVLVPVTKDRVKYYHLWRFCNAYWGNGYLAMSDVVDILKMEADTIRRIHPEATIVIDFENVTPATMSSVSFIWTTESMISKLVSARTSFDVIGLYMVNDGTSHRTMVELQDMKNRLEELGKLNKPIYIWESSYPSYVQREFLNKPEFANVKIDYIWKGEPDEEKQAEFMKDATILALGNPNVIGIRISQLYDNTKMEERNFRNRYRGIIYENGTRKKAFYELQDLMQRLLFNQTIYAPAGRIDFRGLPGSYDIMPEKCDPIQIEVDDKHTNFVLTAYPLGTHPVSKTIATKIYTPESRVTPSKPSTLTLPLLDTEKLQQIGGVAATGGSIAFGWFFKTRKRRFTSTYLRRMASTHNEYSANPQECKRKLLQMRDEILQMLENGKIDEPQFSILDTRLAQHLKDIA